MKGKVVSLILAGCLGACALAGCAPSDGDRVLGTYMTDSRPKHTLTIKEGGVYDFESDGGADKQGTWEIRDGKLRIDSDTMGDVEAPLPAKGEVNTLHFTLRDDSDSPDHTMDGDTFKRIA